MNKQQLIAKYSKKFALKPNSGRPLLEGIHYAQGGTVFITDGHYALRIQNAHPYSEPITMSASNGAPIDGTYPTLEKVFPTSFDNEMTISLKELEHVIQRTRCAADVATRLDKKRPLIMLTATNGETYLQIRNSEQQLELSAFFGNTQKIEASKRSLNAEYLHTALSVFADAGSDQLLLKLGNPLHPIVLTDEGDIAVLILPYRTQPD